MSRPWMPLYIADYLADTAHLSAAEHGAYLLLIMHYWSTGGLPDDDRRLSRITRMSESEFAAARPVLVEFFAPGWRHSRIDQLKQQVETWRQRKVERATRRDIRRLEPVEWDVVRTRIFGRDNYTCGYCGVRGGDLECDHIIPIVRGGSNEDDNLKTACRACNQAKGTKLISEWVR